MQLKPINQQVVAVVGASSGIGRKTALEFARRGAKVVVSARSELKLKSLVEEIQGFGGMDKLVTRNRTKKLYGVQVILLFPLEVRH